jgi:hypothetical protein
VLQIRVVYPGYLIRIFPFRIPDPDPHQRIKIFLNHKKTFLSYRKKDLGCSQRILDPDFLPIPDPEIKKAPDPGSESATLLSI